MPSWFCKIWRFFAGLLKAIVDLVFEIVKKVVDYILDIVESVADSIFSSPLVWAALAVGAVWLLSGREEDEQDIVVSTSGPSGVFS